MISRSLARVVCLAVAVLVTPASGAPAGLQAAKPSGRIVFDRQAGTVGIYVMNGDGSGLRRLTRNTGDVVAPAWSPDGRRIAFISGGDQEGNDVYTMNADGSRQRRLTQAAGADWPPPAWSPDGRKIAFTSRRNRTRSIRVVTATGDGLNDLTPKQWDAGSPSWSPNGRSIAFEADRKGASGIYVMNADGTGKHALLTGAKSGDSPAWSPDGSQIAFASRRGGVSIMRSDGTGLRRLTTNGDSPTWSPDGRRIAFRRWSGQSYTIAVVNRDGSGRRPLTQTLPYENDGNPSWTARTPKPSRWAIHDLGTLGGRQSSAGAINNRGEIVGQADTKDGLEHAVLWQNGTIRDIDPLGDPYVHSTAVAINDSGQVLVDTQQSYPTQRRRAFLWRNGALTEIPGLGGQEIVATAINERGLIIGTDNFKRAFLWQNGVTTDLGGLGGSWTIATAINDSGRIVGQSETAAGATHAFMWDNAKMTDLGTLGGSSSVATAVNSRGSIVGSSETAAGQTRAFLWAGQMVALGAPARAHSTATAINNQGQIIGTATTADGRSTHGFLSEGVTTDLGEIDPTAINALGQIIGTSQPGFSHALLWEDGVISELGTLGGLSSPAAINQHDKIVGTSNTPAQAEHAVLWTRTRAG